MNTFIGSPSYSNGVFSLSIPKDAVKARYDFLQRLGLDLDVIRRLADMLALMEDNQGLEELSVPAVGASIHALADRSRDYILSGLCEEYSEATARSKESPPSDLAEQTSKNDLAKQILNNLDPTTDVFALKATIGGIETGQPVVSVSNPKEPDPVAQAMMNSRKIEALGKSLVKMSDHALPNKSALLDNNSEDLLVMAEMIVTLARETNGLIDQPHIWRSSE